MHEGIEISGTNLSQEELPSGVVHEIANQSLRTKILARFNYPRWLKLVLRTAAYALTVCAINPCRDNANLIQSVAISPPIYDLEKMLRLVRKGI